VTSETTSCFVKKRFNHRFRDSYMYDLSEKDVTPVVAVATEA
jgi:hypothetical protein